MKFNIGEDTVVVHWKHIQFEPDGTGKRGWTLCQIKINGELAHEGNAFCSDKERSFNKAKGRKISYTDALKDMDLPERIIFWKAYFDQWPLK